VSEARLELVEPCEHDWDGWHWVTPRNGPGWRCPGGSRRILTVPIDEMVLAAAKSYHAEVGRRSGVDLAWETSYDSEQADFLRVARDGLAAALGSASALRWEICAVHEVRWDGPSGQHGECLVGSDPCHVAQAFLINVGIQENQP
jgi:hypothetical protein